MHENENLKKSSKEIDFMLQARRFLSHVLDTEEYESLADPRLGGNYVNSEMFQMVEAAAACVRHLAARRPSMGQVTET